MTFQVDPGLFLADFGVQCSAAGVEFLGLLDMPGEGIQLGDARTMSTMYALTVQASVVAAAQLKRGVPLTAAGNPYEVREVVPLDDGVFVSISMTRK